VIAEGGITEGVNHAGKDKESVFTLREHALEQIRPDRIREAIRGPANLLGKTTESLFSEAEHALARPFQSPKSGSSRGAKRSWECRRIGAR
jgi:hypothetical protein